MASYQLTQKAVEDLANIWEYTFETWSEKQADKYYNLLLVNCEKIASDPEIGKPYEGITQGLFGIRVHRHVIFYRILDITVVEITRILHGRMDLKNRLLE